VERTVETFESALAIAKELCNCVGQLANAGRAGTRAEEQSGCTQVLTERGRERARGSDNFWQAVSWSDMGRGRRGDDAFAACS
jgi:hypothetical protein